MKTWPQVWIINYFELNDYRDWNKGAFRLNQRKTHSPLSSNIKFINKVIMKPVVSSHLYSFP